MIHAPIRTIHLIPTLAGGGAEHQLAMLLEKLDRSRFDASVACFKAKGTYLRAIRDRGIEIHDIGIEPTSLRSPANILRILQFCTYLRESGCSILHNWLLTANRLGAIAGKAVGVPVIIYSKRGMGVTERAVDKNTTRALQHILDLVLVNSEAIRLRCIKEGIDSNKIKVIYNGLDLDRCDTGMNHMELRNEYQIPESHSIVGCVGNFYPIKGHSYLVEAASIVLERAPKTTFLLVGDGPLRPELESQIKSLGIEANVRLAGFRRNAFQLFHGVDFSVVPSLSEGFPNVILESFAAGRPVVATNVGGIPEVVEDSVTGYLVPPGNARLLADRVLRITEDKATAQRMGVACKSTAQRFSADAMAINIEKIYEQLLVSSNNS